MRILIFSFVAACRGAPPPAAPSHSAPPKDRHVAEPRAVEIRNALRGVVPGMRRCYEGSASMPAAADLDAMTIVIGADGKFAELRAHGFDRELVACLESELRPFQVSPAPDGGVTEIRWPTR